MGLELMYTITNTQPYTLRVTMKKFSNETRIEIFSIFKIMNQVGFIEHVFFQKVHFPP